MSATLRFALFQIVIVVPFLAGTWLRPRMADSKKTSGRLIRFNLTLVEPFIALWSIWGLDLGRDMVFLPLSGLLLVLAGMAAGRVALAFLPLKGKSRATFLISSSIANHGFTMGAFICYLFLGERGLGLAMLFLSYFLLYVFTVIFPYARYVSSRKHGRAGILREYVLNLQNLPLGATLLALALHALGLPRPDIFFPIDLFMVVSISLYYFSMGTSFTFSGMFASLRENAWLAAIKFAAVPAGAAFCLSFTPIAPELKGVVLLQAFMPAAIYSVVASVLFDLDTGLATNLFAFNTLLFIFLVLPLLFLCRGAILSF